MKQNKLLLQAFVVTMMGFAAHLSGPAPATAAATGSCGWSRCTGVCGVGNPCGEDCDWICLPPTSGNCLPYHVWYEACLFPT